MKLCGKCKISKAVEEFHKGSHQCKLCKKEYRKRYYEQNRDAEIDASKTYSKTEDIRVRRAEAKRIMRSTRNPEEKNREKQYRREKYYKDTYGPVAEVAKLSRELHNVVRDDPGALAASWELRRLKKRRDSGTWRGQYLKRKAAGFYDKRNQRRKEERARAKSLAIHDAARNLVRSDGHEERKNKSENSNGVLEGMQHDYAFFLGGKEE